MGRLFGTDGVRGVAGEDMTCELAMDIGRAAATVLTYGRRRRPLVVLGKDTRLSSDMLGAALSAGLCSVGADVIDLGVVPTPAVAYLVGKYKADAGVMISASHNPYQFNGIKIFGGEGFKLPDALEDQIEALVLDEAAIPLVGGDRLGQITHSTTAVRDYVEHLKATVPYSLDGMKVAVDCANGSASATARLLFEELGADAVLLSETPDGVNINTNCGSTHIGVLQQYVKEKGLDVGFAYDGDADRCIAVDENGNVIDGDLILYVCGKYLKEQGKLKNDTIVTTVMSNLGLYKACDKAGIHYEKTAVGDKYVYENMTQNGHCLGGEQSGHIIFSKHATTGDGILTSLMIMEVLTEKKQTLGTLAGEVKIYPQLLKNVRVADKKTARENPEVQKAVDQVAEALGDEGRILVRESGTEPLIRVMVEAAEDALCEKYVDQVVDVMKAQGLVVE